MKRKHSSNNVLTLHSFKKPKLFNLTKMLNVIIIGFATMQVSPLTYLKWLRIGPICVHVILRSLYFNGVWFGCNSVRDPIWSVLVEIAI